MSAQVKQDVATAGNFVIWTMAMTAFIVFNFSVTSFALDELLQGILRNWIFWAMSLSVVLCFADFGLLAGLLIIQKDMMLRRSVTVAWVFLSVINAGLIYHGITLALRLRSMEIPAILTALGSTFAFIILPVFTAVFTWVARVLLIKTFQIKLHI